MRHGILAVVLVALITSCKTWPSETDTAMNADAQAFIDDYTNQYVALSREAAEAEWASNTRIVEGDDANATRTRAAMEALAKFTGSEGVIASARSFLEHADLLTAVQCAQLERILYLAANNPQTAPDLVARRIAAETAQNEKLYGFTFKLNGAEVTTNQLDEVLKKSTDVNERLAAWTSAKAVGDVLGDGLADLQNLRNETVSALGYADYFSYQVSEYGMTADEMAELCDRLVVELRPLYRELHTWVRYELAKRYGVQPPELIPAHWLPNRWGQDWTALVEVEGFDLDGALRQKSPEWIIEQAERFYVSLGFEKIPASFWTKSSLYPAPADADYKKNNHASAWHMDLERDVRCLMSIEANAEWFETTHHELGHIYYYLAYTHDAVPPLLREGANRAFHEAVGSLLGLAAMQPLFVKGVGLDVGTAAPDPIQTLLKEALNYVVFIPWSAGVMTQFERDLYAKSLSREKWNDAWWELKARYQGIAAPSARLRGGADAATKTHINDDAAQYYDYALSYIILFQLHDHIATKILGENPRNTNYFGHEEIGTFLTGILEPGATVDSQTLLERATGSAMTAAPMLRYFEPLMEWLKKENAGRTHTLPELDG